MLIEHRPPEEGRGPREYLVLSDLKKERGYLQYYFNLRESIWCLEELHSNVSGGGKTLVRAFCELVGSAQKVYAAVIEDQTIRRLISSGVYERFILSKEDSVNILITDNDLCKSLKITRVLEGGGLKLTRVVLDRLSENECEEYSGGYPVGLTVFAETLPIKNYLVGSYSQTL